MSEHQKETTYFRRVIFYDDTNERCKPERSTAQVQRHKLFLQRFASVMAMLTVLAIVGVGWMAVFAGLLMGYPKKLKRLRDARQLVTRRQESHTGKPEIATLPGICRTSDDRDSIQGAEEVSGYHGGLDSPSWFSNRLCG